MFRRYEYLTVFFGGGTLYTLIEILWRGYSHYTMTAVGGACFLVLHLLNRRLGKMRLHVKCLLGGLVITVAELAVGLVVNRALGLAVWDYSKMWGNICGQICPTFSLAWIVLCAPAFLLSDRIIVFFDGIRTDENENEQEEKIYDAN